MTRPDTEHDREDVIAAIHRGKGKVTLVATILNVTPQTVYNYAKRWKTVQDAIDKSRRDFREGLVDKAEIKLEKALMNDRAWAIKYALATQGKDRGYTERQEHHVSIEDLRDLSDDELQSILKA